MRLEIIPEEQRKWWTLGAVAFGLFMIMLDNTVVNVALPSIQRDLGADLSSLEWIVTGYALTFAALMLIGGKLADAYGRRLIFVTGIAIFTASSLACGLAGSEDRSAPRSRWMDGSATFTTVLSSMIMKRPNATAASVHHFRCSSGMIRSRMSVPLLARQLLS